MLVPGTRTYTCTPRLRMMAAEKASFERLAPYSLTGVKASGRELGRGSYATVVELDYFGLKCAGKKIHRELIVQPGAGASYAVTRFEEECRLLSQIRHPNIVQFLGVYFTQKEVAPMLVMEFLPENLTSCIERYGILSKEISYTILHDVAVGLCYLHSQTPAIVHRDLSANNVLLTPNMNAKISDLGVARILSLSPLQLSHMTETPGTPAYMPPEVMVAKPKYDTSIDIFSFGILVIHVLCGQCPEPQVGPTRIDPETERLTPVSEAERRERFLESIGSDDPLMDFILRCIDNYPKRRPHATEIVDQLTLVKSQVPVSFANRLEMLQHIAAGEEEKRAFVIDQETKMQETQEKEQQILSLLAKGEANAIQVSQQFDQMKLALSTMNEQQRLLIGDLESQIQVLTAEKLSLSQNMERVQSEMEHLTSQMNDCKAEIKDTVKSFETRLHEWREKQQVELAEEKQRFERMVQEEKELHDKASVQNLNLQVEVNSLRLDNEGLKKALSLKDEIISGKNSELKIKSEALQQKDATMSGLSRQLSTASQFLATKQQVYYLS